jgi:ferric-dicitrate binding protein FerR (iron transport regulator)
MKEDLENIILMYLEGTLDEERKVYLLQEISENKESEKLFLDLKFIWETSAKDILIKEAETENEFEKLKKNTFADYLASETVPKKFKYNTFFKYAAIFIIGFGLAYFITLLTLPHQEVSMFNMIIVPKGQRSQLVLADGTKIWLNSDTKLKYPEKFIGNSRKVFLDGEAYFEVAKSKKIPFIVDAGKMEISVMGTTFNVRNYPEDKKIETVLIEGKVSLRTNDIGNNLNTEYILKPNQKATFIKSANAILITDLKVEKPGNKGSNYYASGKSESVAASIVTWKEEVLSIDNESFLDITRKLERWYGYEIKIKDTTLLKNRFKGRFDHHETIFQVLDAIRVSTPIKYIVNEKTITIDKR